MARITPNLWFDGNVEEAANFYVSLLPDSHVDAIRLSPADNPSVPAGSILLVEFTLAGMEFVGINGGPADFKFNESISFQIDCEDQAEVDRLWEALTSNGGSPGPCGWCKDRFGLSWQVIPRELGRMMNDSDRDAAARAMEAMLRQSKIDLEELRRAFKGQPVA